MAKSTHSVGAGGEGMTGNLGCYRRFKPYGQTVGTALRDKRLRHCAIRLDHPITATKVSPWRKGQGLKKI